jgi:transcriptional regulator with XRE-family HTH domain
MNKRQRKDKSQHTRTYLRLIQTLRQAREQAGLKQEEVAEHFGTYPSFVSKIESGERRIDVVELAEFCKLYGVNLADFLRSVGLTVSPPPAFALSKRLVSARDATFLENSWLTDYPRRHGPRECPPLPRR